jgi:hypothetical protein
MKKILFIVSILSLLLIGCEKKEILSQDNVLCTELQPSVEISSVHSLVWHPSGCGNVPSPSDSSASISLDINNDGTNDFTIYCSSWYHFVSASIPCGNYNTSMTITGTNSNNQIATNGNFDIAKLYSLGEKIESSGVWKVSSTLMRSSVTYPYGTNFEGSKYLGLKIRQEQNDYFGWLYINKDGYVITVMSYAINLTVNNSIITGQTE